MVTAAITNKIVDYENGQGLAFSFRQKRGAIFRQFIEDNFADKPQISVIDLGGREEFWQTIGMDYLKRRNFKITLVNLEDISVNRHDLFEAINGDATKIGETRQFDICFSNSTIEHVGRIADMVRFRDVVTSVASSYFIQTPSYYFPIEPHFMMPGFQWLPTFMQAFLIRHFNMGHHSKKSDYIESLLDAESAYLLTRRMMAELFPDAHIEKEKIFGLTKSYMAIKA